MWLINKMPLLSAYAPGHTQNPPPTTTTTSDLNKYLIMIPQNHLLQENVLVNKKWDPLLTLVALINV